MLAAAFLLASAAGPAAGEAKPEHAFALVAQAMEAIAGVDEAKPHPSIPADVEVWDNGAGRSTLAEFADYARECPLDRIERFRMAQASEGETLIAVTWECDDREVVNEALVSVGAGGIKRIAFRPLTVVRVR